MQNSTRSHYLLVSATLIVVVISLILIFFLSSSLPYTDWPFQRFPMPTPTPSTLPHFLFD